MENSTSPKGEKKYKAQKVQPKKPLVSPNKPTEPLLSDTPTRQEGAQASKIGRRYFKKTTYIKGFGVVAVGEALTTEMAEAWKANTDVKIDSYVGKKDETLKELPQTDKEKLAAYEALTKD